MSSIRQNNLFAAEDWKVVYDAFANVSLKAYDYSSIYNALVDYLRVNNPDEFNDYVAHSEMMAHINMLSYLGQSLAFRVDLNARENFFSTAERRESILNLAYSLSYNPSRNKTSHGLLKVMSVVTTQPVMDNQGNSLSGKEIQWNQINDSDWYDSFIRILNSSFVSINKFGSPTNRNSVEGIITDLYAINSLTNKGWRPTYPFSTTVNGKPYTFDIVNSEIEHNSYYESAPSPTSPFKILYRNDNNGVSSPKTGFFLQFKEGELRYKDFFYDDPLPNRHEYINDSNINNTDVWVQSIDNDGNVVTTWEQVDSMSGQNIAYNSINKTNRQIFFVKSGEDNSINIIYPDGNFGDVPTGNIRVWYRISENNSYIIRPNDIRNKTRTIFYNGHDGQEYQLTVKFSLTEEVYNAEPEEHSDSITKNAPLLHYTQGRMVNGVDYNTYPITKTSLIKKLKTVNRTYAGHSRYIDINDPTGSLSNLNIVGDDGLLFKEDSYITSSETISNNTNYHSMIYQHIEKILSHDYFKIFYNDKYRKTILSDVSNGGKGNQYWSYPTGRYVWKTLPNKTEALSGYFFDTTTNTPISVGDVATDRLLKYIRKGSVIQFTNNVGEDVWATIRSSTNNGIVDLSYMLTGTIKLSRIVRNGWTIKAIIPSLRSQVNPIEANRIEVELTSGRSFGLSYDHINESWNIIEQDNILDTTNKFDLLPVSNASSPDNTWLLKVLVTNDSDIVTYQFIGRGIKYVFGSNSDVQFHFKNTTPIIDPESGRLSQDYIEIMESNTNRNNADQTSVKGRAIIGQFKTVSNHTNNTYYDISMVVSNTQDYSNIQLYNGDTRILYDISDSLIGGEQVYRVKLRNVQANTIIRISNSLSIFNSEFVCSKLPRPYRFSVIDNYINNNGKIDNSKISVVPIDSDLDGVIDYPLSFDDIVSPNDVVILKSTTTLDGNTYETVDTDMRRLSEINREFIPKQVYFADDNVIINDINGVSHTYEFGNFYLANETNGISQNSATVIESYNGISYRFVYGRSYSISDNFMFRWKHYADADQRIDPSISNIMACYVLTNNHDNDMRMWLKKSGKLLDIPEVPTTNAIRTQLLQIEDNKMYSDQLVYIPSTYKLLFGRNASPQHQASFKVIKTTGTIVTDNEIRSRIVSAINEYFNIDNWDFGDGFYFSELNSYIHSKLIGIISSVVIVPRFDNSRFGDLFEITAEANELFLSTATVDDIEVVRYYNDYNLRKKQ